MREEDELRLSFSILIVPLINIKSETFYTGSRTDIKSHWFLYPLLLYWFQNQYKKVFLIGIMGFYVLKFSFLIFFPFSPSLSLSLVPPPTLITTIDRLLSLYYHHHVTTIVVPPPPPFYFLFLFILVVLS